MPDTHEVTVASQGKECTFDIGQHDTRASRLCGNPATSIVLVDGAPLVGSAKFRCQEHEGKVDNTTAGEVVNAAPSALAKVMFR